MLFMIFVCICIRELRQQGTYRYGRLLTGMQVVLHTVYTLAYFCYINEMCTTELKYDYYELAETLKLVFFPSLIKIIIISLKKSA